MTVNFRYLRTDPAKSFDLFKMDTDIHNTERKGRVGSSPNGLARFCDGSGMHYRLSQRGLNICLMNAASIIDWSKKSANFYLLDAASTIDWLELDADNRSMETASITDWLELDADKQFMDATSIFARVMRV